MRTLLKYLKYIWLLLFIAAAVCFIFLSKYDIPRWVKFEDKTIESATGRKLNIINQKATLFDKHGNAVWNSDEEQYVQDAIMTDIDRNGDEELIILLWKNGRYGIHKPFWIKEDEEGFSQHIFIYDICDDNTVKAKWFASDLGREVRRFKLISEESGVILEEDIHGENTLWFWSGWGIESIDNEVRLVAFGDNIIHEEIYKYADIYENGSYDFLYEPFKKEIEAADIASVQAETILVDKGSAVGGYPSFGSPISVGKAIVDTGFDIAVCGNNHALDRGIYGIDVTTDFYEENGIKCVGIQGSKDKDYRPYEIISRNGIRFALFSYTYGTNGIELPENSPYAVHYLPASDESSEKSFIDEIKSADEETDFKIVYVHWGDEYKNHITKEQMRITELLSEAGADVVIGTHPHVVQKTEMKKRPDGGQMLVYYSLGNFRANQSFDEKTKKGAEAVFTVEHTFDGIKLKEWAIKELNAVWK